MIHLYFALQVIIQGL